MAPSTKDMILLVADSNTEYTVKGLLSRPSALGIRDISFEVARHPERDPGCYLRAPELLRPLKHRFDHALVIFDHHGSGCEEEQADVLEQDLQKRLSNDWEDRAEVVVLEPELEAWVWSDSPHVAAVLGWQQEFDSLQQWLLKEGWLKEGSFKPDDPKGAVESALRLVRKPRSSALYRQLASKVSLGRCRDPKFLSLRAILKRWFGE